MRLHSPRARVVLPVCGALVVGVGIGSAIGWMAGGDPSGLSGPAIAATTATGFATTSFLGSAPKRSQNDQAVALIQQATIARTAIPWSGTQVVTTWSSAGATSRLVDLSHRPGQGTTARLHATEQDVESPTYVPDGDGPEFSSDAGGTGPVGLLTRTYTLQLSRGESVAGHPTTEVLAKRADGSVAARLWIDQDSGLLLRRELVDPRGTVTHSAVFVQVTPGEADGLSAGQDVTSPWTDEVGAAELASLRQAGWACPQQLSGGMTLYDVRRTPTGHGPQVVHLAYSDGLVNVSVFEERGHLVPRAPSGYTATTVNGHIVYLRGSSTDNGGEMTWQAEGTVYTVVADAPSSAVAAVIAGLPAGQTSSGGWSRVRRGLHRMGSWVDPTG
jgi:sigma-E factor negative regulatory protein RseB